MATDMKELVEALKRRHAEAFLANDHEALADVVYDACQHIEALTARAERLEGALRHAEHVTTSSINYFLKCGAKKAAAELITARSIFLAALEP
jgi:hypothetical protein